MKYFHEGIWKEVSLPVPTKLSDFTNDLNFVSKTVSDLTYYYTKSETYTKDEINGMIGDLSGLSVEVVQSLPEEGGKPSTIYLVPAGTAVSAINTARKVADEELIIKPDSSTFNANIATIAASDNDAYDEYIYVNAKWERIGSTAVDLTQYYTKTEVDNKVKDFIKMKKADSESDAIEKSQANPTTLYYWV